MNDSYLVKRAVLLQQMAALDSMELGSLKAEYRPGLAGSPTGPYFKHQVWKDGANQSQRVSPEDAGADSSGGRLWKPTRLEITMWWTVSTLPAKLTHGLRTTSA